MLVLLAVACAPASALSPGAGPASVPADGASAPGGRCSDLVDVDCDDYWDPCEMGEGQDPCEPVFERHCLVWHTYLDYVAPYEDMRHPLEPETHLVCQDNPYAPWPSRDGAAPPARAAEGPL